MSLMDIMLSEISQAQKEKYHMNSLIYDWGRTWGGEIVRGWPKGMLLQLDRRSKFWCTSTVG
jgi:hypothetical protein